MKAILVISISLNALLLLRKTPRPIMSEEVQKARAGEAAALRLAASIDAHTLKLLELCQKQGERP